jgi:hypothetical protein
MPSTAATDERAHPLTATLLVHGCEVPNVTDWLVIVKLPFGAPGARLTRPPKPAADHVAWALFHFTPESFGTRHCGAPTVIDLVA